MRAKIEVKQAARRRREENREKDDQKPEEEHFLGQGAKQTVAVFVRCKTKDTTLT